MNNFGSYITPAQAKEFGDKHGDPHPLAFWQKLAARKVRKCEICSEPQWIYGRTGMCFTCTTGQSDASDDMELRDG